MISGRRSEKQLVKSIDQNNSWLWAKGSGLPVAARQQAGRTRALLSCFKRRPTGQSTIELAVMTLGIVTALVIFFSYLRSSVAYRIKVGSDAFGHGLLCNGVGCR